MRFAHGPFLLLLLLIPLLVKRWYRKQYPTPVTFSLPIPKNLKQFNPTRILLGLKILSWTLLVVSLARPQAAFKETERSVNGIDIVIALDVSYSMNIEDMGSQNRLTIAKETMERFIKGRTHDRIGFIAFSGEPITLSPPTLDYGLLLAAMRTARTGDLKDGTAIGDGLALAVSHLKNSKAKSKIIVLLTDGDSNVGQVDPSTGGELAAGYGIRVYTIAIGREGRVKIPIPNPGGGPTRYQYQDSSLNPELLMQIAEHTHGKFYRVMEESALRDVFDEIDKLEKTEIKSKEKTRYEERFQKPLKAGLLFLGVEQVLSRLVWRVLP